MKIKHILLSLIFCATVSTTVAQNNIAEEVAWMIGDVPIYKSEIEELYQQYKSEQMPINGDPYCVIPETMAIQRLFLHQAELDTIEVSPSTVQSRVDGQINYLIANLGSVEKVEQYFGKPMNEIRQMYAVQINDMYRQNQVKENLTKDVKVTPADVRRYFDRLPADSVPTVPLQVEVQIITLKPTIPQQEIDNVKARLRDYADRVNKGEAEFSTLAILYSEAPEGLRGGEIGFMGRAQLVPEFAAVAFNLNDSKKVSKIVETEYGYHIIQLIEKRGDRVNCRHILLKPKVSEKDLKDATNRLDSLRSGIIVGKQTFEAAARMVSQDKDTRLSNGVMLNPNNGSTKFEMSDLSPEIARQIAVLKPGEISAPFTMVDPSNNREQVVLVKLTQRHDPHSANLAEDYQLLKDMCEANLKQAKLDAWIENKIKSTYVKIEDGWSGCEFQHQGWVK